MLQRLEGYRIKLYYIEYGGIGKGRSEMCRRSLANLNCRLHSVMYEVAGIYAILAIDVLKCTVIVRSKRNTFVFVDVE